MFRSLALISLLSGVADATQTCANGDAYCAGLVPVNGVGPNGAYCQNVNDFGEGVCHKLYFTSDSQEACCTEDDGSTCDASSLTPVPCHCNEPTCMLFEPDDVPQSTCSRLSVYLIKMLVNYISVICPSGDNYCASRSIDVASMETFFTQGSYCKNENSPKVCQSLHYLDDSHTAVCVHQPGSADCPASLDPVDCDHCGSLPLNLRMKRLAWELSSFAHMQPADEYDCSMRHLELFIEITTHFKAVNFKTGYELYELSMEMANSSSDQLDICDELRVDPGSGGEFHASIELMKQILDPSYADSICTTEDLTLVAEGFVDAYDISDANKDVLRSLIPGFVDISKSNNLSEECGC